MLDGAQTRIQARRERMLAALPDHGSPAGDRRVAAIIPAYNEGPRVGAVVDVLRDHPGISELVVVDNNSIDDTARVAREHGARVVAMPLKGKGQAMSAGVASTASPNLLFLDGDLLHLTKGHVDQLIEPVLAGQAGMTRGLLDHGAVTGVRSAITPILTGQRAMTRGVFDLLTPQDVASWGVEQALNSARTLYRIPTTDVVLEGLDHVTKSAKEASGGFRENLRMFGQAQAGIGAFYVRHWQMLGGAGDHTTAARSAAAVLDAIKAVR